MAIIYRRTLSVFICFYTLSLPAQTVKQEERCENVSAFRMPALLIDTLLNGKSGDLIIPAPKNLCFRKDQKILIRDESNNNVANIIISELWSGKLKNSLKVEAMPNDSLPREYIRQNKKMGIYSHHTTDFLLKFIFNRNPAAVDEDLNLLKIKYSVNPGYKLNYSAYSLQAAHPAAKKINYKEFLNLYSKSVQPVVVHVMSSPDEWHRLPMTRKIYKPLSLQRKYMLTFAELIHFVSANDFSDLDSQKDIIVASRFEMSNNAYAAINELIYQGKSNLYWFNNYDRLYFDAELKPKVIPSEFLISAEQTLREMQANDVLIVDIRSAEDFRISNIPKSISMPSTQDARGWYDIEYKKIPLNKKIILVHANTESSNARFSLLEAKKILNNNRLHKNVMILNGGLDQFYKLTKWEHPEFSPKYIRLDIN